MKKNLSAALFVGSVLLLASAATRAAAPPTPVPDPKPDISSLSFFVGKWACHSTTRGSNRPDTTTYTMDYDGRWLKGHDIAPPFDKYRNRTIVTDTWYNYNPVLHKWVQTSVDNFGGYGISTSPGWSGNHLVWTTLVAPDDSTGTDTFTKVSATETSDVTVGKDKDGKPVPSNTTLCKKM